MQETGVSVVYPTRDRAGLLMRSLLALLGNDILPDEIIVVDQSRSNDTRRAIADLKQPRIIHVPSAETGLSRGRNRGIAACRFPIVGFLDDDCIPPKNWIRSALDAIRTFPDSSVWIGQDYENANDDPEPLPPDYAKTEFTLSGKNDPWRLGPTGGNSFFRKSVFAEIGSFDPLLGQGSDFPGAEDGDMIYRVLRHNLRVTYANTIRCVHVGWRGEKDNVQNGYNYGMGVGAMLAKYIAEGDFFPLYGIFPRRFLPMFLSLPYNLLLGRGRKLLRNLKWSQGIVKGFLQWRRR